MSDESVKWLKEQLAERDQLRADNERLRKEVEVASRLLAEARTHLNIKPGWSDSTDLWLEETKS